MDGMGNRIRSNLRWKERGTGNGTEQQNEKEMEFLYGKPHTRRIATKECKRMPSVCSSAQEIYAHMHNCVHKSTSA